MTLTFRRLTIENFGPYRGEQTIELEPRPGAPVVLVEGENTLGKTQLFAALRWCLYGTFEPQQSKAEAARDLEGRLNLPARRDGETDLSVTIEFDAEGETYRLARSAAFNTVAPTVSADLRIGATAVPAAGIDSEIGRLLHPQISEFFLFDAELMKRFYDRLATDRERAFIRDSIETVLGIPALQRARNDVQVLANEALQRRAKLIKNVKDSERIQTKLKSLHDEHLSVEKDKAELSASLEKAEADLREVRASLKMVEGLDADVREQEMLEANLTDGRREEEVLRSEMKATIAAGWRAVLAGRLGESLATIQQANSAYAQQEAKIAQARARIAVLEDRARGGTCPTCDQPLPPPDATADAALASAKEDLATLLASVGSSSLDLDTERKIGSLLDNRSIGTYADLSRRLSEVQMLQYERKAALDAISDRLQGHSAAEIRLLGVKNKALEESIEDLQDAVAKNLERAKIIATEQQKESRKLERLPGANPEVVWEAGFFGFTDDLLDRTISAYRERVRSHVEADAQAMFLKLVRDPDGYGGLRISTDYKIELLDKLDKPRPTSEGGKQLLALSLIGALKRAAVRGGPVVLDSPLGRLDLEHRARVLQSWIPALGAQAILLVQSGELTRKEAQKLLGSSIGHSYEIVRPSGDPEHAVIRKAE